MSLFFRLLVVLVGAVPVPLGRRLGALAGRLAYWLVPALRRRALQSLELAFGETLAAGERRRLACASLQELGMTLYEFLALPSLSDQEILGLVTLRNEEEILAYRGRAVIFVSGHLGNLIALGAAVALRGLRATTVVRPFTNRSLRDFVFRVAERGRLGVIERSSGRLTEQCAEVLDRGEALGLIADQDAGSKGVFVDFFGRAASTFVGPVVLARSRGVPLVPIFCVRKPDGTLEAAVEPELELSRTGDPHADLVADTSRHTAALERWVRAYPASYLWLHRRWKTRPQGEGGEEVSPSATRGQ